ncbi:hypothetical protein PRIPAC_80414 [Pristionchus pacificus]|uniref:inorganic diphosphatase n=1 Tax=Pristionchus pacificus TaxID=54126 RepID=A0A454XPK8_PRIPA|nr:hypothetical protein PRIPAC_80414 [Pristionchus pacificus]|eukprot:PDM79856.1 hypothetical protein PRIPAC_32435 [Pristionchus pacificus]
MFADIFLGALTVMGIVSITQESSLTNEALAHHDTRHHDVPSTGVSTVAKYEIEERGSLHTLDYRCYFKGPNGYISPWHDIPLYVDEPKKVFNMIVEIPRWSNAKMEITTRDPMNPIRQDVKNGVPRFTHNIFPHRGALWNYGALPQTWENNTHVDPQTGATGDNDPIDIVEIGSTIHKRGAVIQVKIVGCLALVDGGETDWKLMALDVADSVANDVNSMDDVERVFPGLPKATREYLRTYKIPSGKGENTFGFDGKFMDAAFCHEVIEETHSFWKKLMKETKPHLNTLAQVDGARYKTTSAAAAAIVAATPAARPAADLPLDLQRWHYITESKL